jgi:hypothetical protein
MTDVLLMIIIICSPSWSISRPWSLGRGNDGGEKLGAGSRVTEKPAPTQ